MVQKLPDSNRAVHVQGRGPVQLWLNPYTGKLEPFVTVWEQGAAVRNVFIPTPPAQPQQDTQWWLPVGLLTTAVAIAAIWLSTRRM